MTSRVGPNRGRNPARKRSVGRTCRRAGSPSASRIKLRENLTAMIRLKSDLERSASKPPGKEVGKDVKKILDEKMPGGATKKQADAIAQMMSALTGATVRSSIDTEIEGIPGKITGLRTKVEWLLSQSSWSTESNRQANDLNEEMEKVMELGSNWLRMQRDGF